MADELATLLDSWPVPTAVAGVVTPDGPLWQSGDSHWVVRIASISKLIVGYAALIAIEEGSLELDAPVGRPGATVRHLLAHAAGYDFDTPRPAAEVGRRRVYSNVGIEVLAEHLEESSGMPIGEYLHLAVAEPLGMTSTVLAGSAAHGIRSNLADLMAFARELLRPTLVSAGSHATLRSVHFPDLGGVLPGFGRFEPNPWGLAAEIKGGKQPHWSGSLTSPSTFGHFGGSGTFLWVDPELELACVTLSDREFGPWAVEAWPRFSDEVVRRFGVSPPGR